MRLINIHTLEMEYFLDEKAPDYAILSHRWGDDEISYQEYHKRRRPQTAGYQKVVDFCQYVKQLPPIYARIEWIWIDTCCIDKTSSAELSESINSMYRYYQKAIFCVAFLVDVRTDRCGTMCDPLCARCQRVLEEFEASEYWERGWTLQEVIAPRKVFFVNHDWDFIGEKSRDYMNLLDSIHKVSNIPVEVLLGPHEVRWSCIAQRLSWAANRKTTRLEDESYCLFGLLGINLPLLYGEGRRAWERLLEEIIRTSDDQSIFTGVSPFGGLLPMDAAGFASCSDVEEYRISMPMHRYSITNQGLEWKLPAGSAMILNLDQEHYPHSFLAVPLNSRKLDLTSGRRVPIFVLLAKPPLCGHYSRHKYHQLSLEVKLMINSSAWRLLDEEKTIHVHAWIDYCGTGHREYPDDGRKPMEMTEMFPVWRDAVGRGAFRP